jgi:hypothetical protein
MFEILGPSLFLVRYHKPTEMDPERQAALIDEIRTASRVFPVGIVFVIDSTIRSVDFAVPSFWLKVTSDPEIRISAMGMVTESIAVGIAARGFGAANRFRHHPIEIQTFTSEAAAITWARQLRREPVPAHG